MKKRRAARQRKPAKPLWIDLKEPPESGGWMIGYARVSMLDQSNQRQIDEFRQFGCHRVYLDTGSGRNMKRPGWIACRKDLREEDTLVLHAIDRLGRDLVEVVRTVNELRESGTKLKVLSMPIDTDTPAGRMTLGVVAAMSQMERELMLERTMHGLSKARERGQKFGAQPLHSDKAILDAVKTYGANNAHRHLDPPMSKGGLMKAFRRARDNAEKRKMEREERK